jgi:hypothetical protein
MKLALLKRNGINFGNNIIKKNYIREYIYVL